MTQEYVYLLLYNCKACNRPITCTLVYGNPNVTELSAKTEASQREVWCDGSNCEWHGTAGELNYVRMHVGTWVP
jgi:hypothetical protein